MKYNLYIHIPLHGKFNILSITKEQVEFVVDAYKKGKSKFTLNGTKYDLHDVKDFQIYEMKMELEVFKKTSLFGGFHKKGGYYGFYIPKENLERLGSNVTSNFIGNTEYGEESNNETTQNKEFVSNSRLDELRALSSSNFDFKKLIRLCEELNDNFSRGNYFSVGALGRAILDHIPPLFNVSTFTQVVGNHGGKSFKKNMENLEKSLRNIADGYLHLPIRKKEVLPNSVQVNFSQDLDVLLAEIVRIS
ncbi:hypothetical protein RXV94_03465 [Yeosuana sp. MJ-SS3]|uniref:Uncharacterized protein n=1 Tax=Gilvirhabdus luticola TaxID=3079858 RepID=A0ABU3U466_9FLAO|nr:hypothetical protein [Yeosuana sp. MJ-SS3]MDU8885204.1 hypothetical protein [Yeosuana sp. MJ-SS3]